MDPLVENWVWIENWASIEYSLKIEFQSKTESELNWKIRYELKNGSEPNEFKLESVSNRIENRDYLENSLKTEPDTKIESESKNSLKRMDRK